MWTGKLVAGVGIHIGPKPEGAAVFISSRTPEGMPHHCLICDKDVCIEPSFPPGDAPCPHCGCLLWFPAPVTCAHPATWLQNLARDAQGRPVDEPGNVYDPVTGCVDWAATLGATRTAASARALREARADAKLPPFRRLWRWLVAFPEHAWAAVLPPASLDG